MNRSLKKSGFTLTELIVVIVIIGILAMVLIPTLTGYIKKAKYSNDLQKVETFNNYLSKNSLLYDVKINNRNDLIELLKKENESKELDFSVESDGYYIWYDIKEHKIILEKYDFIQNTSASHNGSNKERSDISEFFKGYYLLCNEDDDYELANVINSFNSLKLKEEGLNYLDEEKMLNAALDKVNNNKYIDAYNGFIDYLSDLNITFDGSNGTLNITINNGKVSIEAIYQLTFDRIEVINSKEVYNAKEEISKDTLTVKAYYKETLEPKILNPEEFDISDSNAKFKNDGLMQVGIRYYDEGIDDIFYIKVNQLDFPFDYTNIDEYKYVYNGLSREEDLFNDLARNMGVNRSDYSFSLVYPDEDLTNVMNGSILTNIRVRVTPNDSDYESKVFDCLVDIWKAELDIAGEMKYVVIGNDLPLPQDFTYFIIGDKQLLGQDVNLNINDLLIFDNANIRYDGFYPTASGNDSFMISGIESKNYYINCEVVEMFFVFDENSLEFIPNREGWTVNGNTFITDFTGEYQEFSGKLINCNGQVAANATPNYNGDNSFSVLHAGEYEVTVNMFSVNPSYKFTPVTYKIIVNKAEITKDMFEVVKMDGNYNGEIDYYSLKPIDALKDFINLDVNKSDFSISRAYNYTDGTASISIFATTTCDNFDGSLSFKSLPLTFDYVTVKFDFGEEVIEKELAKHAGSMAKLNLYDYAKLDNTNYEIIGFTTNKGSNEVEYTLSQTFNINDLDENITEIILYPVYKITE